MLLNLPRPIIYLITNGKTTTSTSPNSREFSDILRLVEFAVASEISLIQIREKKLTAKVLFELALQVATLTRGTKTRLLVNDRFDIALAAGADGVHLTSKSVSADIVRNQCGEDFLIGVSTHSLTEATLARQNGGDFVLFGPVFETESKREFGPSQGTEKLSEVVLALNPFPVIAIGGIAVYNVKECFAAGALGVAAIKLLNDPDTIMESVKAIRIAYAG
jgi:thiamine-phosphate pyrophosphorylase